MLPPHFKLYSHTAPLQVRSYSSAISGAPVTVLQYSLLLGMIHSMTIFQKCPFASSQLTKLSVEKFLFVLIISLCINYKKSPFTGRTDKRTNTRVTTFCLEDLSSLSPTSLQRLVFLLTVKRSEPAYLSTCCPPRPFFHFSDMTFSTSQRLSLMRPSVLSFSSGLFSYCR